MLDLSSSDNLDRPLPVSSAPLADPPIGQQPDDGTGTTRDEAASAEAENRDGDTLGDDLLHNHHANPNEPNHSGASSPLKPAALPELIPVRMLNEFAYCPRLAYLEWVQGEWAESLDTLEGTFGHRRVDVPGRKPVPAATTSRGARHNGTAAATEYLNGVGAVSAAHGDSLSGESTTQCRQSESTTNGRPLAPAGAPEAAPCDPMHARSLSLSAPGEGLTAKLDLLELEGNCATPVDYKRGTAPDVPEGAYEPERVQLCAQGLILRENGYDCQRGVLYFIASRKRVEIEFDDTLVARTRQLVVEMRAAANAGRLPPPLVDSPKCPRCSLVGICLPDETNLLLRMRDEAEPTDRDSSQSPLDDTGAPSTDSPRRLIPTRDDALPLYLQDYGLSLGKDGDQLIVKKKGDVVREVRLLDVSQVCLFGSVHTTEPALRELSTRGVPVCHFSYGGWFYAITSGLVHKNVELRIRQYATAADPPAALALARRFIAGKIRNCRTMLRRHLNDDAKPRLMWQLNDYIRKAEQTESTESLLGIEGMAAKLYFAAFGKLLKGGDEFEIEGRNRRPPRDPINALLSFLYALLTKELTVTLQAVGFDPMLGMLHQPRYGRPSLALDLAEEFRPLIAESTVLTLVNNGEVSAGSFIRRAGAVALTDAGRRAVLTAFERRLDTEVTHPIFGYRISYRRVLEVQSRLLARAVLGELSEYPSFCTR